LDFAIGRKGLPRMHPHHIAHHQSPRRNRLKTAVRLAPLADLGQSVHQAVERASGAVPCLEFQIAASQQEKYKHRQRVEPDLTAPRPRGIKHHRRTHQKAHQNTDGNRRVHAHPSVFEVIPCAFEERAGSKEHHRQTEQPTRPTQQLVDVGRNFTGLGHIRRQGVHHHLHGTKTRHKQAPQRQAGLAQTFADGQSLLHGQEPVARTAHCLGQAGHARERRIPAHREAARGRVHLCAVHAGQVLQGALNRVGAGRAIHALHHQNRLRQWQTIDLGVLGEIALLDRVVEHREIVRDGQRSAVRTKQACVGRGIGCGYAQQAPDRGRGNGLIHAVRVVQVRFHRLDLNQPSTGKLW
jgi:hypothetical protein